MDDKYTPQKIATMLLEAEVLISLGISVDQACQRIGISEVTYFDWKRQFSTPSMDESITQYTESPEQTETVLKLTEQQILSKIYQQILVCLLQHQKTVSSELNSKVKSLFTEAEKIEQILHNSIYPHGQISIACTKGCSHCCNLQVKATQPELNIIRDFLFDTCSPERIDQTKSNLKAFLLKMANCESRNEKIAVPCGLLEAGVCGVYEVRPLTCRAWNSTNVEICIRYLTSTREDIPASICHYAPYDVIKRAIIRAFMVTGFDPPSEELNAGLLKVLQEFGET